MIRNMRGVENGIIETIGGKSGNRTLKIYAIMVNIFVTFVVFTQHMQSRRVEVDNLVYTIIPSRRSLNSEFT